LRSNQNQPRLTRDNVIEVGSQNSRDVVPPPNARTADGSAGREDADRSPQRATAAAAQGPEQRSTPSAAQTQPAGARPQAASWAQRANAGRPTRPPPPTRTDYVLSTRTVEKPPERKGAHGVVITAATQALQKAVADAALNDAERDSVMNVAGNDAELAGATIRVASLERSVELAEAFNKALGRSLGLAAPACASREPTRDPVAGTTAFVRPSMRRVDNRWVCPLLAKRGDLSGWPAALYAAMTRAGVISPAAATIELRGATGRSPFMKCVVPVGLYSKFKQWTLDEVLEVHVPQHPLMWALLVPASDNFLESTDRVRAAKDVFGDGVAWGRPERIQVDGGMKYFRVDFEVPLGWTPPATAIDLGDGVEVRIAAPTEVEGVEKWAWRRPSPPSPAAPAAPRAAQSPAEEADDGAKRRSCADAVDAEYPALTDAPPQAQTHTAAHSSAQTGTLPPTASTSSARPPPAPPAATAATGVSAARGDKPAAGSVGVAAARFMPGVTTPRPRSQAASSERAPPSEPRGRFRPRPASSSAASTAPAEPAAFAEKVPPVIDIFEPPGGFSEDWYGVVRGKDGPAVVYPDYGQVIGATKRGSNTQGFKSKEAAIAFCARAHRIPPHMIRTAVVSKAYAYDATREAAAAAERETTPLMVDDDHSSPYFGEGELY
jgi:hypothetical protein